MKLLEATIDGQRLSLRRRSLLCSTNDPRREPREFAGTARLSRVTR